jgi:NAD(P)-dependent dehydrogenase (short-subunit alcohol dehydrogenase family)
MKKIFLTGASSGIGEAIAHALIARGDEVWGTSRNLIRLEHLHGVHPVRLDLADARSIDDAFKCALAEAGYFDVVINNAGNGHFGPAEHLAADEIERQFQVLLFGHLQLMRLALAAMRSRGDGSIINVTSLASRLPVPFMAAYNAAKAAMASFTMSIQLELPDAKIRIVDLQPADICTTFNDAIPKTAQHDPRYETRLAKTWDAVDRNMKNAPKPELVAEHVLRLIDSPTPPLRATVGDLFQTKIAPFIFRFLPQRVRLWGLKMYYGI